MIAKVIAELEKIEDATAQKLVAIFKGTQAKVEDGLYATTVFKSQEGYTSNTGYLNSQMVGSVQKALVETPLVFTRGKEQPIFCSFKGQGIAFGFTLVDYRSSKPLVVATIDLVGKKYEYKSIKFDKDLNSYTESEFSSVSCSDVKALLTMVLENLSNDVNKWIDKY